jgi:branched-chain amino acid transport system substrate-binding protein
MERPSPAASFRSGLELYLDELAGKSNAKRVNLVVEDIGYGVARAIGASRKLVEKDEVDLVVGLVNPSATRWLREIFEKRGIPFIEASAGERIPDEDACSPMIFRTSLELTRAAHALGEWSVRELGRCGAVLSSLHNSGFDMLPAFRRGVEERGGAFIGVHVTDARASSGVSDMRAALEHVAIGRPDYVCAAYSRHDAVEFMNAYRDAGLGAIPIVGLGLMADTHELDRLGRGSLGIRSALAWSEGIDTKENRAFMASYRRATGIPADAFALLGYETAGIIGSALCANQRAALHDALSTASFAGPRVTVTMDRTTRSIDAPLYLCEVRRTLAGPSNTIAATLGTTSSARLDTHMRASRHGLLNSYLSV